LVDRIGAEIDKRVDARLGARPLGSRKPAESPQARSGATLVLAGAAVGAGVTGLVAILARDRASGTTVTSVIWIWVILAVICLGSALVRRYRERG